MKMECHITALFLQKMRIIGNVPFIFRLGGSVESLGAGLCRGMETQVLRLYFDGVTLGAEFA